MLTKNSKRGVWATFLEGQKWSEWEEFNMNDLWFSSEHHLFNWENGLTNLRQHPRNSQEIPEKRG
jgi:hypothetical protein